MYEYYYTHCAGDEVGDAMALFSAMSKEGWRLVSHQVLRNDRDPFSDSYHYFILERKVVEIKTEITASPAEIQLPGPWPSAQP